MPPVQALKHEKGTAQVDFVGGRWWSRLGLEFEVVQMSNHFFLVGGLEHEFYFSICWECHHPNGLSYFSEGLKPPTSVCFFGQSYVDSSNRVDILVSEVLLRWLLLKFFGP